MDTVKSAVQRMSEVVFPGIKVTYKQKEIRRSEEIMSSLALQMGLYYNVTYSPVWIVIRIGCLMYKFSELLQLYKILLVAVISVMTIVELARLYLGYVGNLTEKVPELAGFWMLTVFLQFPLHCLCLFGKDFLILPWEKAADIIMMIFIMYEIIVGYFAVKIITNHQALKFKLHMMQLKHNT